jgi:pimeloyl-ACP methyl ester carboxylesterase
MTTKTHIEKRTTTGELHVETWGDGEPVVLVHGSLATAGEEWAEQVPLADEGYRLVAPNRRGYGSSPAAEGEDFLADADDVVELMGDGAHLVGHSYGGLAALLAAARRPEATLSLAVLEPPALRAGHRDPDAMALIDEVRHMWDSDAPDDEWVVAFLRAVGSDPESFPPDFLAAAVPLVPVFRQGRPFWQADLPIVELASARFPKLVVSGGHSAAFEAMCSDLAGAIGASRTVVEGAGHEVQFATPAINTVLHELWRSARPVR